jgi:hypothetical protein
MNRIAMLEADLRRGTRAVQKRKRVPPAAGMPAPSRDVAPRRRYPQYGRAERPADPAPPDPMRPRGAASYPPGSVSASVANAMSAWSGRSRPRARATSVRASGVRARAMALTLNYRVPNLPLPLKQPSTYACWATVATMMASWRDQTSHGIDQYLASLGGAWAAKFAKNEGLSAGEAPQLLATMGLQVEPAQNYAAEAWEGMLRDFGPLWVTHDPNAAPGIQGSHAMILVGIHGPSDGDPTVDVIDPAVGAEVSMPMSAFVARYEQLAPTNFAGLQLRHWPAGAQRAAQQSIAWAEQAATRLAHGQGGPAAAVIAAAGLGWDVFKTLVTESNRLSWNKAELRGIRIPGDDESKKALTSKPFSMGRTTSKETIVFDAIFKDYVGAEFDIEYRHNGNCIADVKITNKSYAPPARFTGRDLSVDTDIIPAREHERNDVAAVQVTIVYSFANVTGSQGTFVHRIVLFGDGRTPQHTRTEG